MPVSGTGSSYGGVSDFGTVFKMTSSGALTTLVDFTGNGASNKGHSPHGLMQGSDGTFYGTTFMGGANGKGTIFKMTASGVLTTLVNCVSPHGGPLGTLLEATDGTLYGTLGGLQIGPQQGPGGAIYRLIFPGRPLLFTSDPQVRDTSSAIVQSSVNPRGSVTSVSLEYGLNADFPTNSFTLISLSVNISGFLTRTIGSTISDLNLGQTYYYRFRASSSAGTTVSPVQSFSTLEPPIATAAPATQIGRTSARLNGTVNARNYDATVRFEWGSDGNSFPNNLPLLAPISGNTPQPVFAPIPEGTLRPGQVYYYRVVATNAGGTVTSGATSFTTLTDPVATVAPASLLTSLSAKLNGMVNALGVTTHVTFEYGVDGINFPYSFGGTPGAVNGNTPVAVSATISNSTSTPLLQGVTYTYRVRGTSAGGTGVSGNATFSLDILSGFAHLFPNAPASAQGFVLVNLSPFGINSGWRFVGEQLWRAPGSLAVGLTTGNYSIEYRPIPGYTQPPREILSVISGGAPTLVNQPYTPAVGGATGNLSVVLQPSALALPGVAVAQRAQWRFLGENNTQWRDSGTTVSGLSPGNYLIECKPVTGQTTPPPSNVSVSSGQTPVVKLTYVVSSPPVGAQPALLSFAAVTNNATQNLPYAFVGQIRSEVGASTGFVVKERVVATAGHVVYDDGSLSYVTGLQWLFQRSAGTYEPVPQIPRGFHLLDGYANRRDSEGTPGVSQPASQNMDVAALFFAADAGNGGYGGYLGSDSETNEFLTSAREKILIGYPVDGIPAANQGQMFATPPVTASFAQIPGNDSGGRPYRVYTTNSLTSVGGNSGGPLCALFDDGKYYPAAIYLGGSAQTVVRSIDSGVIDLFNRAQVSGISGNNNTGGGISLSSVSDLGGTSNGALLVTILPAEAATAARWGVNDATTTEANERSSGTTAGGLSPGDKTLKFASVNGFQAPTPQLVRVTAGQRKSFTFTYAPSVLAPLAQWRSTNFNTTTNTGTAADSADFDGDGSININEYAAGTDPKSSSDVFKVLTTQKTGTSITLTTAGKKSRTYGLQRSPDLTSGAWTTLTTTAPLPADGPVSLTDPTAPPQSTFYRIQVSLP